MSDSAPRSPTCHLQMANDEDDDGVEEDDDDSRISATLWPLMGLWCVGDKCLLVEMVR